MKVEIDLPRAVIDFLRMHEKDLESYLTEALLDVIRADIDRGVFAKGKYVDSSSLSVELKEAFREKGININ